MPEERNQSWPEGDGQNVVFVNTALIWRAMEKVQQSQADFQALLEQADDPAVSYDLGMRYAQGDGVDADAVQAVHWFSQAAGGGGVRLRKRAAPAGTV